MTEPELAQLKAMLPLESLTKDENELIQTVVNICEFMISCLTYDDNYYKTLEAPWFKHNCDDSNVARLARYGARDPELLESVLWYEMQEDFKNYAVVHRNTHTDSEGLSYNSLEWKGAPWERTIEIPTKDNMIKILLRAN